MKGKKQKLLIITLQLLFGFLFLNTNTFRDSMSCTYLSSSVCVSGVNRFWKLKCSVLSFPSDTIHCSLFIFQFPGFHSWFVTIWGSFAWILCIYLLFCFWFCECWLFFVSEVEIDFDYRHISLKVSLSWWFFFSPLLKFNSEHMGKISHYRRSGVLKCLHISQHAENKVNLAEAWRQR